MMQTRHSAPRPLLFSPSCCSTSLSLLASDSEAISDLHSLLTPSPLPPIPPPDNPPDAKSDPSVGLIQRKRPLNAKQSRFLDGILGLASMVVETEGVDAEGEIQPEPKEEEPKGKRKAAKSCKETMRKKQKVTKGNNAKAGKNGQNKSHHKAKTSHAKAAIQYMPFCKLSNHIEYMSASSPPNLRQSWDLYMQSIPPQLLPTPQPPQTLIDSSEPRSEKSRKSTIHVAIAFFIRGDMQDKKSEVQD